MIHRAYGRETSSLDVAMVADQRGTTATMRTLLHGLGVRRLRVLEDSRAALTVLSQDAPDLIFVSDDATPIDGCTFCRLARASQCSPLSFASIVLISWRMTQRTVSSALRAGAHQLLCLPISAESLRRRVAWLCDDDRGFEAKDGSLQVEGIEILLDRCQARARVRRAGRQSVVHGDTAAVNMPVGSSYRTGGDYWEV